MANANLLFSLFHKKWAWPPENTHKTFHCKKNEIFVNLPKIIGQREGKYGKATPFLSSFSSLLCYSPANKKVRSWENWFERAEVTLTHVLSSPFSYLNPSNTFPILSLSVFFTTVILVLCVLEWASVCVFSEGRCQDLMSVWEELGIVIVTNPSEVPWLDKF